MKSEEGGREGRDENEEVGERKRGTKAGGGRRATRKGRRGGEE